MSKFFYVVGTVLSGKLSLLRTGLVLSKFSMKTYIVTLQNSVGETVQMRGYNCFHGESENHP